MPGLSMYDCRNEREREREGEKNALLKGVPQVSNGLQWTPLLRESVIEIRSFLCVCDRRRRAQR
jgi:hypothetical protein